jgi:hypothetical protein
MVKVRAVARGAIYAVLMFGGLVAFAYYAVYLAEFFHDERWGLAAASAAMMVLSTMFVSLMWKDVR